MEYCLRWTLNKHILHMTADFKKGCKWHPINMVLNWIARKILRLKMKRQIKLFLFLKRTVLDQKQVEWVSALIFFISLWFCQGGGGGDELVNRSYRDRAVDDLGHRDVTRNLSRELWMVSSSEIVSWFQVVKVETLRWNDRRYVFIY